MNTGWHPSWNPNFGSSPLRAWFEEFTQEFRRLSGENLPPPVGQPNPPAPYGSTRLPKPYAMYLDSEALLGFAADGAFATMLKRLWESQFGDTIANPLRLRNYWDEPLPGSTQSLRNRYEQAVIDFGFPSNPFDAQVGIDLSGTPVQYGSARNRGILMWYAKICQESEQRALAHAVWAPIKAAFPACRTGNYADSVYDNVESMTGWFLNCKGSLTTTPLDCSPLWGGEDYELFCHCGPPLNAAGQVVTAWGPELDKRDSGALFPRAAVAAIREGTMMRFSRNGRFLSEARTSSADVDSPVLYPFAAPEAVQNHWQPNLYRPQRPIIQPSNGSVVLMPPGELETAPCLAAITSGLVDFTIYRSEVSTRPTRQNCESVLDSGVAGYEERLRPFVPWFEQVFTHGGPTDGPVTHITHEVEFKRWMGVLRGLNITEGVPFTNWNKGDVPPPPEAHEAWKRTSIAIGDIYAPRIANSITNVLDPGQLTPLAPAQNAPNLRLEWTLKSVDPANDTADITTLLPGAAIPTHVLVTQFRGLTGDYANTPFDFLINIECGVIRADASRTGTVGIVEAYDFAPTSPTNSTPRGWTLLVTEDTDGDGFRGVPYNYYGFYNHRLLAGQGELFESRRTFVAHGNQLVGGTLRTPRFVSYAGSGFDAGQMWVRIKHQFTDLAANEQPISKFDLVQVVPVRLPPLTELKGLAGTLLPPTGNSPTNPLSIHPNYFSSVTPLRVVFEIENNEGPQPNTVKIPLGLSMIAEEAPVAKPLRLYRVTQSSQQPFVDATCKTVQTLASTLNNGVLDAVDIRWVGVTGGIQYATEGPYILTARDLPAVVACAPVPPGQTLFRLLRGIGPLGPKHSPAARDFVVHVKVHDPNSPVPCGGVCVADVDDGSGSGLADGGVGIEDLLYYLGLYDLGSIHADVDDGSSSCQPDGGVGIEDLLFYLYRYDAGC
jgi:hypothetical protein